MEDLLIYLLKSAGLLVVFLAFYQILLKKDPSFKNNRGFLLGGIIASAVLPAVYFTRKIVIEAIEPNFFMAEVDLPVAHVMAEEPAISGYQILVAIYLCGVAFMLVRLMLQLISLQRIISKGKLTKKDGFKYVLISQKIAPFSFLNYIVYNPNLHTASERENILKHEKIHVTHWHTTDVLLANLNQIYQWFNPFAWIYLKSLQQNLEYIADSEAVKEVSCKKEYQKALLKISVENFNPALTNSFYQSFIKKRIIMLNNNSNSKNQTWKTALIFPVLFAFLLLFNVKTEAQIKTQKDSAEISINRISATITKESEESSLKSIKRFFEKQDIQLDFENIQRSSDGFITGISVNFLNRNTNASGNFSKNDPDGINSFEIYVKDGETGFADVSTQEKRQKTTQEVLNQIGENPLYVVDGEEYAAGGLEGKSIEITDGFIFLNSENSTKYGDRGKDGVIMISKGKIINDISEEMRSIDQENAPVKKSFIQIRKGEKPVFMEVNKTSASKLQSQKSNVSIKTDATSRSGALGLEKIKGNPIYILNEKVVEKSVIDSLQPNNIKNITVLKGEKAVSLYGNAARDGAILITTKTPGTTVVVPAIKFSAGDKEERIALYHELNAEKKKALIILNGKKQPENFDLNSIDPDEIQAIDVQRGKDIITKYGKAAKDGVITISTVKSVKIGTATSSKIPTNINISENTKFSKYDDKAITITGATNRIIASQWGTRSNPANIIFYPQDEKPLVVIDGKEKEADFDMKSINPEDIESINVLKGENATKEYGDKGKNGVIEIELKDKKEN
ncbi:M56 family metallopeptidase [Gillisia limnaea]|uniref:Peptidase M56 BlaR1 n=1 Tax=Gillisia limnaea (strain DSM 15749 / LMG 21470 / R-8282) TaxID=865937 RepID=H2BS41_GILLR|nr:M56 family metallopeptidase [Gillisia limnaea]EHQ03567.1 peptidase M56 BlaR1 [Gillisia limnaea DSM 15749]